MKIQKNSGGYKLKLTDVEYESLKGIVNRYCKQTLGDDSFTSDCSIYDSTVLYMAQIMKGMD